jgi:hypothetical protein
MKPSEAKIKKEAKEQLKGKSKIIEYGGSPLTPIKKAKK